MCYCFRQYNLSQLRIIEEGQNADLCNLAAFLKFQCSGILAVCKGIVAHSSNILSDYDLLNVITKTCPRLLRLTGEVRHRTGTGDFHRTIGIECPGDGFTEFTGSKFSSLSCTNLNLQIVVQRIGMPHRAFCNLKYHVGICVKKYISAYTCDSVRNVNGF